LLEQALRHRSVGYAHYERLEFLGDGLLNYLIGEALYQAKPHADEGALSRLRASLVKEPTLAQLARALALGEHIELGAGELKVAASRRDSILADVFEAIIGAISLDSGFAAAKAFVLQQYQGLLADLPDPESLKDAKTRLQEHLQAQSRPLPRYEVLAEQGPDHARKFQVSCTLDTLQKTLAEGASRKHAEQEAARLMLLKL
jgi:ribonuclease-3